MSGEGKRSEWSASRERLPLERGERTSPGLYHHRALPRLYSPTGTPARSMWAIRKLHIYSALLCKSAGGNGTSRPGTYSDAALVGREEREAAGVAEGGEEGRVHDVAIGEGPQGGVCRRSR